MSPSPQGSTWRSKPDEEEEGGEEEQEGGGGKGGEEVMKGGTEEGRRCKGMEGSGRKSNEREGRERFSLHIAKNPATPEIKPFPAVLHWCSKGSIVSSGR